MIIAKGIVLGLKILMNSYNFLVIIVLFECNRLEHLIFSIQQSSSIEELTTTANKLRELATDLKNKLLES